MWSREVGNGRESVRKDFELNSVVSREYSFSIGSVAVKSL